MSINERIYALRKLMKEHKINIYIIPSDDFHQSENVGEYFRSRTFMSGFTGSAGTLLVTEEESFLWTDGRYFIQAEKELSGSEIKLMKAGTIGTPTILEFLKENIKENSVLGFDGRTVSYNTMKNYEKICVEKNSKINTEVDFVGKIWENRPPMSREPIFVLDTKYAGEDTKSKLQRVRNILDETKTKVHIISALDEIAWLFNIRGKDIACTPVVLSYAIITMDKATLFIDKNKISHEAMAYFEENKIEIKDYFDFYKELKNINERERVLVDFDKINSSIYKNIPFTAIKINRNSPCEEFKAIKNETEIENIKKGHIKDGVLVTKFMYWLKNNYDKMEITELSAASMIDSLREKAENFIDLSFPTISAFGSNAAMMHYSASEKSNAILKKGGLLLVDSGGQYLEGTTDITRTFAIGEISDELKLHFTTVLKSMISLSKTKFLHGVKGYNLDAIARAPIWELGIDYRCGTGHGVGYLSNVHEGPNNFRLTADFVIEKNMITTVEPGIYVEGSHGIRIENEVLSENCTQNEYGQFMKFTPVTVAPIDLDAVDPDVLSPAEKKYLNDYHREVFEKLSPYLNKNEKEWLKTYTRKI